MFAVAANTEMGERLRALRTKLRLTQAKMAAQFDVDRETYKNWEYGAANLPKKFHALLTRLEAGGLAAFEPTDLRKPLFPVPHLLVPIPRGPAVPCSDWSDPLEADYNDFTEVDPYMAEGKGRFACEIVGDSMYDLLWPGDLAIWQSEPHPKIGTVVIARTKLNEVTAAQLKHNGTDFVLHKLNSKYEDATADHWEAIGFLVGIIRVEGSKRVTAYDPNGIRP